jgi:hypothetical protein
VPPRDFDFLSLFVITFSVVLFFSVSSVSWGRRKKVGLEKFLDDIQQTTERRTLIIFAAFRQTIEQKPSTSSARSPHQRNKYLHLHSLRGFDFFPPLSLAGRAPH